jgi:signal transduction histidine kinase
MLHGDMGKLTKMQTEYLKEVYKGNQRMVELVSSLLDVSRLDLGRMVNHPKDTDFAALVKDLEKELTTNIQTKKTKIVKHFETKLPPVVGDPKLLRMIVQNLMSNAVKYTPEKGTVELTVRRATPAEAKKASLHREGPYLFFEVKDTGYGIPKEQQAKIFGKLFRADNVRKMEVEGNGLGLYIVKQVAEKLGGRIWFASEEGKGTTFFVIIPFKTIVSKVKPDEPTA